MQRCGSATTGSARRCWPASTPSAGARCTWRWRGGWHESPQWFAVAAEQYLPAVDEVTDTEERRQVVALLRRAADQAGLIGDYALVSSLLAAAVRLVDPGETGTLVEVRTARHAALYSAGRLDEADEEYRAIGGLGPTAAQRADAAALQVYSLTHRIRFAEAIALGVESLRQLGIAVPTADRIGDDLDRQVGHLHRWLERTDGAGRADPAGDHRPHAAGHRASAARGPAGHLLRRSTRPDGVDRYGSGADLARSRPGPRHSRPGQPRRLQRRDAARRGGCRLASGVAADAEAGRRPRLRTRHLGGALPAFA